MNSESKTLSDPRQASFKKTLRAQAVGRLKLLNLSQSQYVRERLFWRVQMFLETRQGIWGVYMPLSYEADPRAHISHIQWVYPKTVGPRLDFYAAKQFTSGPFGLQEPVVQGAPVALSQIEGLLIPGLAFDRQGHRLGHGKGYYDQTLQGYQGLRVGVAFQAQILAQIPADPWDQPMDFILTEQSTLHVARVNNENSTRN